MEEKKKNIKLMNLIVLILVILVIAALVIGFFAKARKRQERVQEYSTSYSIDENTVNKEV